MMWNVVENFVPIVDEHIKLIKALSQDKTVFFVRKESIDFEELEEKEKSEIIEENYELFKEGILWFDNENTQKMIEIKIVEIINQIEGLQIDKVHKNISSILEAIEKNEYIEYLEQIKKIIMDSILEHNKSKSLLHLNNYAFKTENNESHKYYNSNGELENDRKYFEWYKINNIQEIKSFIEDNNFNYNIIMTQSDNFDMQYEYYINYYEGTEYILAVRDNKGNFSDIFANTFKGRYLQNDSKFTIDHSLNKGIHDERC